MRRFMKAASFACLASIAGSAASQQYQLQLLPNADLGWGINSAGDCTGTHYPPPGDQGRAFIYSDAGGSLDLPPVGSLTNCLGYAINDFDQVAGTANDRPAIWTNGVGHVIPMLPDYTSARVTGISNSGLVIGYSSGSFGPGPHSGFLWGSSTGVAPLLPLAGSDSSRAYGINDSGTVVGLSFFSGSILNKATEWVNGVPNELAPGQGFTEAFGVNDSGNVVGYASGRGAVFWNRTGPLSTIGWLPGFQHIYPTDINNRNVAVGGAANFQSGPMSSHGWVWDSALGLRDLNTVTTGIPSGWAITDATGINDQGQIVGFADNGVNAGAAVRLDPVPEPSSIIACGIGLAFLLGKKCSRCSQTRIFFGECVEWKIDPPSI